MNGFRCVMYICRVGKVRHARWRVGKVRTNAARPWWVKYVRGADGGFQVHLEPVEVCNVRG